MEQRDKFIGVESIKFYSRFTNDDLCLEYLSAIKWAEGFKCKKCGHTAASVYFAALENGDTLVQYQLVVLKESTKDLYYLNYMAPVSEFDNHWETADSVFNTIKLK